MGEWELTGIKVQLVVLGAKGQQVIKGLVAIQAHSVAWVFLVQLVIKVRAVNLVFKVDVGQMAFNLPKLIVNVLIVNNDTNLETISTN
jgi:hypothetical protein